MSLHDSIRLMMTKLGVTKKQHGAIMEWEQFEGVMERRPETKKNAEMTFSVDAIDKEISSVKKNFPVSGISNFIDLAI